MNLEFSAINIMQSVTYVDFFHPYQNSPVIINGSRSHAATHRFPRRNIPCIRAFHTHLCKALPGGHCVILSSVRGTRGMRRIWDTVAMSATAIMGGRKTGDKVSVVLRHNIISGHSGVFVISTTVRQ
jgi:hypothetical protein